MATKSNPGKFDCYAKAEPDEPIFVLLGRDPLAAYLVAVWAEMRILTSPGDKEQADEAGACSMAMAEHAKALGKQAAIERASLALQTIGMSMASEHIMRGINRAKDKAAGK